MGNKLSTVQNLVIQKSLDDENDLFGQITKFTKKNLKIGFISNTRPSIKNCLRYLSTLKYEGLFGVPKFTINNAFFIFI